MDILANSWRCNSSDIDSGSVCTGSVQRLPGDSAPSLCSHTTAKGSLVSYLRNNSMEQWVGLVTFLCRFFMGHLPVMRKLAPDEFLLDTINRWYD